MDGGKAKSWTGTGPKQPLTAEALQRLFTSDQAQLRLLHRVPSAPLLLLIAGPLPIATRKMARTNEAAEAAAHEAVEQTETSA